MVKDNVSMVKDIVSALTCGGISDPTFLVPSQCVPVSHANLLKPFFKVSCEPLKSHFSNTI